MGKPLRGFCDVSFFMLMFLEADSYYTSVKVFHFLVTPFHLHSTLASQT